MAYRPRRYKTTAGSKATIPIKNKKDMKAILIFWLKKINTSKTTCKKFQSHRNYIIHLMGFNTAFRAEDLLQLKVSDVMSGYISITEFKRKKKHNYPLNQKLYNELLDYIEEWSLTKRDYLFPSLYPGYKYPVTRQMGDKILKTGSKGIGLKQPFSMHSLRKTFAYQKYIETRDIYLVQRMLGHDDPNVTLIYICWDSTDSDKEREKTYYSGLD